MNELELSVELFELFFVGVALPLVEEEVVFIEVDALADVVHDDLGLLCGQLGLLLGDFLFT